MKWFCLLTGLVLTFAGSAQAQGLIWSLPEDGKWVRYEGTYTQTVKRPESTQGDLTLTWRRYLTIKSVGREEREYQGKSQACRWIEIKTETGKTTEGVLDAGPGGIRMYKLLVPESAIQGQISQTVGEGREIFNAFIPAVEGYRRIGDEPAQKLTAGVFQLYPLVSLLRHYRQLDAGEPSNVTVPAGSFQSTNYSGQMVMETPGYRSTNSCVMNRSDEFPFGVVKWTATTKDETKGTAEERSAFTESVTLTEEMQAVSIGEGAESEFLAN